MILFALAIALPAAAPVDARPSTVESRRILAAFVHCAVARNRDVVSKALVEDWPVGRLMDMKKDPLDGRCMPRGGRLRSSKLLMRAALAEELVLSDKQGVDPAAMRAAAPLNYHASWPIERTDPTTGKPLSDNAIAEQAAAIMRTETQTAFGRLGECIARANPVGVRGMLASKIGTDEERSAAASIAPNIAGCVKGGEKVKLKLEAVRGAVAIGYFRVAMAARGVVWAGEPTPASEAAR